MNGLKRLGFNQGIVRVIILTINIFQIVFDAVINQIHVIEYQKKMFEYEIIKPNVKI